MNNSLKELIEIFSLNTWVAMLDAILNLLTGHHLQ